MGDLQDQGLMDAQWTDALSVDQLAELLSRLNVVYELVLSPCPLSSPGAALETLLTEVLSNQEPAMTRLKLLLLVGTVAYADCSMEEKEVAAMLRCDYHNSTTEEWRASNTAHKHDRADRSGKQNLRERHPTPQK